jgi:hypothetical protein
MSAMDVQQLWQRVRREIADECEPDKGKLALAEIMGLRMLALESLNATKKPKPSSHKNKSITR